MTNKAYELKPADLRSARVHARRAFGQQGTNRLPRRAVAAFVAAIASTALLGAAASGASAASLGERAYELVSPAGSNANLRATGGRASADGDTVCFATEDSLAGSTSNGSGFNDDAFCSYRTAGGWGTEWLSKPQTPGNLGSVGTRVYFLSDDGGKAILGSKTPMAGFPDYMGAPDDPEQTPDINTTPNWSSFMYEDGGLTWLTPRPLPIAPDDYGAPVGVNDSFDRVVFQSSRALLPGISDPGDPFNANGNSDVFVWTPSGLRLISVDENGAAMGFAFVPKRGQTAKQGVLAKNGSRIFFESSAPSVYGLPELWTHSTVYMWEDGEVRSVSPRRGPDGTEPASIEFVGASDDGEIVYLRSEEQLTADPKQFGAALYRYTVATDELELVVDLPGGMTPIDVSADGSTVFYRDFVNLYVYRNGTSTPIGQLSIPGDLLPQRVGSALAAAAALRLSADGSRAVLAAEGAMGSYPASPGVAQVYLWEAGAGVTRISESDSGAAATQSATFGNYADLVQYPTELAEVDVHWQWGNFGRVWTDDHETVFFQTSDALLPDDQNQVSDVYAWSDGELELITPGTPGPRGFYYHASSADGRTLFFHTFARVLPASDRNPVRDIYAARVGGGFPEPPPGTVGDPPGESGPGPVPPPPDAGTGAPRRDGQAAPGTHPSLSVRKLASGVTADLARRGRVAIRVATPRTARVVVRATATLDGKRRTVGRTSKRLRADAASRVVVRLSKAARAALSKNRQLRVALVVTGAGADPRRVAIRLRLPARG